MAASGAEKTATELSTADDAAATQLPYTVQPSASARVAEGGAQERQRARRPAQRVRTVRLTTQVHPDELVPYLYGERGGRSINAIVNSTGCTIDYCALSPDEPERSPQSLGFVMNFLVSAGSSETLEDATRQLRTLVDRLQLHLQKKARGSRSYRPRDERKEQAELLDREDARYYEAERPLEAARTRRSVMSPRLSVAEAAESKREAIPDERWMTAGVDGQQEEAWNVPAVQRMYYAPGGPRVRRERPIYMEVTDENDEKSDFVMTQVLGRRATDAGAEASYIQQRGQSPVNFVARRRVRRYPEQPRWTPRNYPAEAGYTMFSPQGGSEQAQRIARSRQPRRVYQGAPNRFAQTEYSTYEYDDGGDENSAEFPDYEAGDLTNESAGATESAEFADQHQPVHQTHPRRSLKRPRSNMRSDGPPPPPIYRQRMPYIYDYAYEEEEDEWMTEDEDMTVAYGYPPQYRRMETPGARPRRRFDSIGSQHWGSPAGRGPQRIYKRPRIPQEGSPLEYDMSDVFAAPAYKPDIPPPSVPARTPLVDQLDDVADHASTDMYSGRPRDHADTTEIPMEEEFSASSTSEAHSDNALLDDEIDKSPASENTAAVTPGEVLTESTASTTASIQATELTSEQENASPNKDPVQSGEKTSANDQHQEASIGHTSHTEVVPLDPNASTEVATTAGSPPRTASSPARKTPESRTASPPPSISRDVSSSAENATYTSAHPSVERSECTQLLPNAAEVPCERSVQSPTLHESEHRDLNSNKSQLAPPTVEVDDTHVESVVTDTIRINNHVIASLDRMNKVEADFVMAKTSLSAQEDIFRQLESSSKWRQRLEVLCGIVYDLQCQIGSRSCGLDQSRKQDLLDKLDSYLENLSTVSEQTLQDKVNGLQADLEHVLAIVGLLNDNRVASGTIEASKANNDANIRVRTTPISLQKNQDKGGEPDGMDWEGDGWFEESMPANPVSDSEEQDNFATQISPKKGNMKFGGDFLAVKLEEGASPRWPRELPPFVWSLLARVVSSDPQSYVMRVTHKRLMDEIAKGDPYYYLHPTIISEDAVVSSPLRLAPPQGCEFGCRGASALKWERKLVSQISSRMKSFDNVAYSLARSSGGKEVLNRKKMNSIIRKLHLVAMQLHSLVSHLYCVKGQATCKEVDSLPIALNNSHFERKMGVYKSRLKLVVPHKYQQQQTQQQPNTGNEPTEELLRDTYEFFPELLLCVDIWGYNYREGQTKRRSSKGLLEDKLAGPGVVSEGALFPLGFFRGVESLAFDFEHDSNGLLRCICDELLNIVCLWNDFKWTDNLEAVALERVMSFETDVTASILKILELYSHHLQALWAVRLLDEPEQLRSVHFTQFNAYYSDRSQGSLKATAVSQSRQSTNPGSGSNSNARVLDQLVANEMVEQHLAEQYWNRKVTALSIHNPDDDAMEVDGAEPKPSQLLSPETICSWDQHTLFSFLLRWSDVYAIRSEVNALSAVTNHMLKHEVQKYQFSSHISDSGAGGADASKSMIDTLTRQILAAISRAQMLIRDALMGTEKLALHSASSQLPEERKYPVYAEEEHGASEASETHQPTNSSCEDDLPGRTSTSSGARMLSAEANEAISEPVLHSQGGDESATSHAADSNAADAQEEVDGIAPEQPELKDLIQLLAVTKQGMQDLCGRRPRSARMREKVQAESLQLARQSVEIFRNIRNMYGSQRR